MQFAAKTAPWSTRTNSMLSIDGAENTCPITGADYNGSLIASGIHSLGYPDNRLME